MALDATPKDRREGKGKQTSGAQIAKSPVPFGTGLVLIFGRGGGIRTRDPLHPMQVRYQAALHPDEEERL